MKLTCCRCSKEDGISSQFNYIGSNKLILCSNSTPSKASTTCYFDMNETELDSTEKIVEKHKQVQKLTLRMLKELPNSSKTNTHLLNENAISNTRDTFTKSTSTGAPTCTSFCKKGNNLLICSICSHGTRNFKKPSFTKAGREISHYATTNSLLTLANLILFATILCLQVSLFSSKSIRENPSEQATNNLGQTLTDSTSTTLDLLTYPIAGKSKSNQDHQTTTLAEVSSRTTLSVGEDEDELSGSKDDDGDAQGCQGISANESAEGKNISDSKRLVNLQACIQRKMRLKLAESTREGLEMFQKLSLNGGCSASLMNLMSSLGQIKSFAFKFLDASAKVPSGVMYGLLSDFGDFDQCVSIRSNPEIPLEREADEGAYSGKYCLMNIVMKYHIKLEPNTTVPDGIYPDGVLWDDLVRKYWTSNSSKGFQVGMCFPSRCTMDDINQLYQYVAESYNFQGQIISCQDGLDLKRQYTPDFIQGFIIFICHLFILITILASLVDRYYSKLKVFSQLIKKPSVSLSTGDFSAKSNLKASKLDSRVKFAFKLLRCFSISRNWTYFTQINNKEGISQSPSFTSSASSGNSKVVRTIIEGISARSSVDGGNSSNESTDSNESLDDKETCNINGDEKLRQITVEIEPENYFKFRKEYCSLSHLTGLKLFVILWITMGYSFLYPSANNYQHYRSIINMNITRDSVWFATTNFTLGIDMLLYMSGLLFAYKVSIMNLRTTYGITNKISCNGGTIRLIMKNLLSFCPSYLTVIALAIVTPLMGDGPMWPEIISKKIGNTCRENWWTNLLFINNFWRESELCLPSSWFISVLVQLFLIGYFIIMLERKHSSFIAWIALITLLITSSVYSFIYSYLLHIQAPVIKMDESFVLEMDDNIWRFYINIFSNLGPFLVGMAGGFILVNARNVKQVSTTKTSSLSRSPVTQQTSSTFAWFNQFSKMAIFMIIAILVLSSVFHKEYSPIWSSVYWSLHRIGWALVTGYLVHNCATGRWKLLHDMLSLSVFNPLSKLFFISYLVYPIFTYMHSGLVRDGLHVSIYNMLTIYIARLFMTFITALFIHLLVALPLNRIGDLCLQKWLDCKGESSNMNAESKKVHSLLAVAETTTVELSDKSSVNQKKFTPCGKAPSIVLETNQYKR